MLPRCRNSICSQEIVLRSVRRQLVPSFSLALLRALDFGRGLRSSSARRNCRTARDVFVLWRLQPDRSLIMRSGASRAGGRFRVTDLLVLGRFCSYRADSS